MEPRKIIFSDHHESRLPGKVFGDRGYKITSQLYKGGTILYDSASRKTSVHNQVPLKAEETIMYNIKFEREAMGTGVPVESYSTDNGIYNSKEFIR